MASLDTMGVFFHCYRDRDGTMSALQEFRWHYAEATIHLICDGGDNFGDLADKFNCRYFHERHIGLQIKTPKESMHEWLRRFERTCLECPEDWIFVLEDDVWVRKSMSIPEFPMAGANLGHKLFQREIGKYVFARHPHLVNYGYGGGGGSIVNRVAALESIRLYREREDFDAWKRMTGYVASDIWLTCMLMAAGYQYGPNWDLVQTYSTPDWETTHHAVVHARVSVAELLAARKG